MPIVFFQNGKLLLISLLLLWSMGPAHAAQFVHAEVSEKDDTYTTRAEAVITARPDQIRAVLTDYENLNVLSPTIQHSVVLDRTSLDITSVKVQLYTCAFVACSRKFVVQDYTEHDQEVRMTVHPGSGGFRFGRAAWRWKQEGDKTRVFFSSTMRPDFWLPPLVGTSIVKEKMREEVLETVKRLEHLSAKRPVAQAVVYSTNDHYDSYD
ncbi:MAG: SRPBCC family protein [Magnetococcales bacterium]|nr:SRPBCC family protein [Magnetococcales bacterium]